MTAGRTDKGRFASGNKAASVRKAKTAPGSNGVRAYGGYVDDGERDTALVGAQKWVTYANAFNRAPAAIAAILRYALMSGAKWTPQENKAGGKAARKGAEIVQEGLLDARLESGDTWQEVVAKAGMSWFNGSSLHAFGMGRRKDGLVVFTDIAHRPMHTIDQWLPSDGRPFDRVVQRKPDGATAPIDLSDCLYIVERMMGDHPSGVGVLRFAVERIRRANSYERLEGHELFSSLGGLPVVRVPLEEIRDTVKHLPESEQEAAVNVALNIIEQVVRDRVKTPDKQQFLTLSSKTYEGADPNTISAIQKWAIEIVKGEMQGLADIRKVITEHDLDLARLFGVEFVFVGGGTSAGTYGMHESKVTLFQATLQTSLNRIGSRATQQLARRLIAANGLDPDTATPTLVPEEISVTAILEAAQLLVYESQAGAHPEDEAWDVLRERAELPPRPKAALLADMMAPRDPAPPGEVDDELGEDEIDDVEEDEEPEVEPVDKEPKTP